MKRASQVADRLHRGWYYLRPPPTAQPYSYPHTFDPRRQGHTVAVGEPEAKKLLVARLHMLHIEE